MAPTEAALMDEPVYRIMYDCKLRKVGCVLLQQVGGTLPSGLFWKYFGDSNCWLVYPTDDLKLYPITESQLPLLAAKTDFTREP
jgi:hypothetical protein